MQELEVLSNEHAIVQSDSVDDLSNVSVAVAIVSVVRM